MQHEVLLEGTRACLSGCGFVYWLYAVDNLHRATRGRALALDRGLFAFLAGLFCFVELAMTYGYGGKTSAALNPLLYAVAAGTVVFYARALRDCLAGGKSMLQLLTGLGGLTAALALASLALFMAGGELPMSVGAAHGSSPLLLAMTGGRSVQPSGLFTVMMLLGLVTQVTLLGAMLTGFARGRYRDLPILFGVLATSVALCVELGLLVFSPQHFVLLLFAGNLPEVIRSTALDRRNQHQAVLAAIGLVAESEHRRVEQLAAANRALQDSQDQLVQASKLSALGMMASTIAHEIRSPLAAVTMGAELLQRQSAHAAINDDNFALSMRAILSGAERCQRTVDSLLSFSRRSEGPLEPVDLRVTVFDTMEVAHIALRRKRVKVDVELEPGAMQVLGDSNRIGQVLLNLLVNAADATEKGGRLTVRGGPNGAEVRLQVVDAGTGIPPEVLDRVFEPFFTTKAVGAGTGLGLSVSNHIMEEHGGRIEVDSQCDVGTTFTLVFPRLEAGVTASGGAA